MNDEQRQRLEELTREQRDRAREAPRRPEEPWSHPDAPPWAPSGFYAKRPRAELVARFRPAR